jgi:putative Holliday junction resolvase
MKRIMALDLGSKTLGIAITDPLQIISQGLENFRFTNTKIEEGVKRVLELLKTYEVEKILIGYPLRFNGSKGEMTTYVDLFIELFQKESQVEIIRVDERLTTTIATKFLIQNDVSRSKRKEIIDMMAAQVILQDYLNKK